MEIKYMTLLPAAIELYNKDKPSYLKCKGLDLCQIETLENHFYPEIYNKFPQALREMLYLAGGRFSIFETGCSLGNNDTHTCSVNILLGEQNKTWLTDQQRQYFVHNRPIWIFDNNSEGDNREDFSFVYLDEKDNNPLVWRFILDSFSKQLFLQKGGWYNEELIYQNEIRLVEYVNKFIK